MNRYAIISNDIVTNVVVWDGVAPWAPPPDAMAYPISDDSACEIGWTYDAKRVPVLAPPTE